jgi:hypothetical protein
VQRTTDFFRNLRRQRDAAVAGLFISLARAANAAADYSDIPTGRVVEGGSVGPI